jgi:hypothetical protein
MTGGDLKYEKVEKAFDFLIARATDGLSFSVDDMMKATGWSRASVRTYMTKQYRDVLISDGAGNHRIKPEFHRVSREDFRELISQKRRIFSKYQRVEYSRVCTYEFLLPLTREDKLRDSLDDLFYIDTIKRRLREMDAADVQAVYPKEAGEGEDAWLDRVATAMGDKFGGYSVLHVRGRFRRDSLKTRQQAADLLVYDQKYLIDETTALVRFVIPLAATRRVDPALAGTFSFEDIATEESILSELRLVRWSFFNLFGEAIVRTVQGEDEIWLVEDTGTQRRLYVWERS